MSEKIHAGWLFKRGGRVKTWKKRYFVLTTDFLLAYYDDPGATAPKGSIDMSKCTGTVSFEDCETKWDSRAQPDRSFGIETNKRTFYVFGENLLAAAKWRDVIEGAALHAVQERIQRRSSMPEPRTKRAKQIGHAAPSSKDPEPQADELAVNLPLPEKLELLKVFGDVGFELSLGAGGHFFAFNVQAKGSAAKAGLTNGDQVVEINRNPIVGITAAKANDVLDRAPNLVRLTVHRGAQALYDAAVAQKSEARRAKEEKECLALVAAESERLRKVQAQEMAALPDFLGSAPPPPPSSSSEDDSDEEESESEVGSGGDQDEAASVDGDVRACPAAQTRTQAELEEMMEDHSWFVCLEGDEAQCHVEAERMIRAVGAGEGAWTLYYTTASPMYILAQMYENSVQVYPIHETCGPEGTAYSLDGGPRYASLATFVQGYKQDPQGLPAPLTRHPINDMF